MITFFFFLFGLIVGSFLNVVVLRFEKEESLGGRSHCPKCQALIHWYDNIPVFSYLFLRGKCRACKAPISWQYPLVELVTGLVFAAIGFWYFVPASSVVGILLPWGILLTTLWYLFLSSLLIVIIVTDVRTMEIPLIFLNTGVIGSLMFIVLMQLLFHEIHFVPTETSWQNLFFGGLIAAFIFWALVFFSKETWMGKGDIWLAAIVGFAVGIQALLFTLTLSFCLGAVVGISLLVAGKKSMQSQIPFAPFLVGGLFISLLLQWINPLWLSLVLLPF